MILSLEDMRKDAWVAMPIAILRTKKLTSREKLMYVELRSWWWIDSDFNYVFPKQDILSVHMDCSERRIQQLIAALRDKGLIETERVCEGGNNRYYFCQIPDDLCTSDQMSNKIEPLPPEENVATTRSSPTGTSRSSPAGTTRRPPTAISKDIEEDKNEVGESPPNILTDTENERLDPVPIITEAE